MRKLSIVSPVFREQDVLDDFHDELTRALEKVADRYAAEIIYVLDPSPDRSLEVLRQIAQKDQRVKVLVLSTRAGHQMSLVAGIDEAQGDAVVMLDSDLQHPPSLIPLLLKEFEKGYDVVFTIREATQQTSAFRRLSSKLFYGLINKVSQVAIDESAADFRLISKRVANVFQTKIRERNQFLRGLMSWVGFSRIGIPFKAQPRGAGATKYSFGDLWRFAITGVLSFSKRPLQAAILLGFALALGGLLVAGYSLFMYFYRGNLPSGWTTLAILTSGFSGVQLIFLGVLGEYIGAIFDEVKARPHYIIQERITFEPV